jgi:hypothetical protein
MAHAASARSRIKNSSFPEFITPSVSLKSGLFLSGADLEAAAPEGAGIASREFRAIKILVRSLAAIRDGSHSLE